MIFLRLAAIIGLSISMSSCVAYYSNNTVSKDGDQEIYTEYQLKRDGTFDEYIYRDLIEDEDGMDYGNKITGTYEKNGDTLFFSYNHNDPTHKKLSKEIYLIVDDGLVKLDPISYSYHFLHQTLNKEKASKLRELPVYESIIWVEGY
ncbi:hypothetical protein N8987_01425 [Crocinitomix sp.]|nr:hypothetical protein [Crocinitomix sp.]